MAEVVAQWQDGPWSASSTRRIRVLLDGGRYRVVWASPNRRGEEWRDTPREAAAVVWWLIGRAGGDWWRQLDDGRQPDAGAAAG